MSTSADKAYQTIKEKIITLDMAPGTAIHEVELAGQLQLGRTPVREALKLLQAEKLVTTVPRRGMFVSSIAITDLQEIAEVRVELEGLSARLAAERATDEELAEIGEKGRQADGAADLDPRQAIHLDRRLHTLISAASHNDYLISEVERFYNLSLRLWYVALARVHTADLDMHVHSELFEAIQARDAARAEELMREHIRSFHRSIRAAM